LGLGKRIRNPASDHYLNDNDNDYHHDDGANNYDHGCAHNHHDLINYDDYNCDHYICGTNHHSSYLT
jgi:hypothetical protein